MFNYLNYYLISMQISVLNKILLSLATICLVANMTALPLVFTAAVPSAVEENFATFPLDSVCGENGDCSNVESDWETSVTTRDYFAWDLVNLDEVLAEQASPRYQKKGPYTYEITSEKTLLNHDSENGELTYNVVKSYQCASDSRNSCTDELTQLNIQFRPQLIGATGTAINGIMDLTKIGFASGMMGQDLNTTQAGVATSQFISTMANTVGGTGFGTYAYGALTAAEAAGQVSVILPNTLDGNILPVANFLGGLDQALYNSVHPLDADFDISLVESLGPVAFMAMGEPEALLSDVEANPSQSVAVKRATAYGYLASEMLDLNGDGLFETESIDYAQTYIRDWAMYIGIGLDFQANGGGSQYGDSDDIAERLNNLLDVDFADVDCLNLLLNGDGTSTPKGLQAQNAGGTGFGLSAFLDLDSESTKSTFGLNQEQYDAIYQWASQWAESTSFLQLALLGTPGTINAKQFVNTTFGGGDPISGGYLQYSMNQGGDWEILTQLPAINLTAEQSGEILYGPLGLTTTNGAAQFLYGELSGNSAPGYLDNTGSVDNWDLQTIATAYNITTNEARALQELIINDIFGVFVSDFLINSFGTQPYLTQSVDSWLLGWHDPVSAFLTSGDSSDMSVGWASLESNKTYFGSNNIANGDGTNYTICTGERNICEKGELIREDGSTQLSWRNDRMFDATLGLITQEEIAGTTGGFISGNSDKVDVSGYAVADIICSGESDLKGIPVYNCSASVDPTQRLIQANLLKTFSLLDATPSALPIYLGSEITLQSEQLSGLIIAGDSTTRFYLDTRDGDNMQTPPSLSDLTPVFEIQSTSTISNSDAEAMRSAIVQNQNYFTYWANFDTPLDLIPFLLWVTVFGALFTVLVTIYRELGQEEEDLLVIHQVEQKSIKTGGLLQLSKTMRKKS